MKYKSQGTSLWVYLLLMFVSAASCAPKELFVAVTGVSLSQTAMSIEIGQSIQLTATISPSNASDNTVSWSSSAPAIATVSGGSVTAIAIGNALITASAGGKKDICRVTVTEKQVPVTSVALDQTVVTILAGETLQLHATVLPGHVTHAEVTWNTDNSGVAIVDTGGQVTGISEGTALITAEAGGKTAQCRITVEAAEPSAYEIWYTSTDGLALPGVSESNVNIASLRCVEGVWRIRFRYAVSEVPSWVFKNKETLKTVILPKERVLIERNTYSGCSTLE